MFVPKTVSLYRAACPRCGWVVVATTWQFRAQLCDWHNVEVHHRPSLASLSAPIDASSPVIAKAAQPA